MFKPENAEGEQVVAARPKEEVEAELALLAAEEEETNQAAQANKNAQQQLLDATKQENEELKQKVQSLEEDVNNAKRSTPTPVAIPTGGEATSAEIQQMIADFEN